MKNLKNVICNRKELRSAVIGMMLGNLSILSAQPKSKKAQFQMFHFLGHEGYVDFKAQILEMHPVVRVIKEKRAVYFPSLNQTREQWHLYSNENRYAGFIRSIFYRNNKKHITRKLLNQLSDFGLYLWYLDRGYLNVRFDKTTGKIKEYRVLLYTTEYPIDEVKEMRKWFEDRYGIDPNIHRTRDGYALFFNSQKTRLLMDVLNPFYEMVPCLQMKFLRHHIPS